MARLLREVVYSNQSESTHADLQKQQGLEGLALPKFILTAPDESLSHHQQTNKQDHNVKQLTFSNLAT